MTRTFGSFACLVVRMGLFIPGVQISKKKGSSVKAGLPFLSQN